jgi:Bacterial regulatory proteins, luxR family
LPGPNPGTGSLLALRLDNGAVVWRDQVYPHDTHGFDFGWIARGKTSGEIAAILVVSPHTVRKHVEHILEKLYVSTRSAAVARAFAAPPSTAADGRPLQVARRPARDRRC